LSSIKQFIRIPKITLENKFIKNEIIKQTEHILELENYQLKDFVEFNTFMQKFSSIKISENNLILIDNNGNEHNQKIKYKTDLLKKIIKEEQYKKNGLFAKKEISLQDLKFMQIIDKEEQNKFKNYIDHLIFALYFDVKIEKIGINEFEKIKKNCETNKYYKIVNNTTK